MSGGRRAASSRHPREEPFDLVTQIGGGFFHRLRGRQHRLRGLPRFGYRARHLAQHRDDLLGAAGHGVLFTTHDPNQALRAADRAYLLRDGKRLADGTVAEVLERARLEELYGSPVEKLNDPATGAAAFLPGW